MPLHVEILYNEYNFVAAFAVASLLAVLALVTLVAQDAGRMADADDWQRHASAGRPAQEADTMSIEVTQHHARRFGSFTALRRRVSLTCRDGRAAGAAGPVGLGQDHAAADHRRAGSVRPDPAARSSSTART